MARQAGLADMRSREREERPGMIEDCPRPPSRRMANRTIGRKTCCRVIRIGGPLEVSQVTTRTILRRSRKPPVQVTLRTLHADVCSG